MQEVHWGVLPHIFDGPGAGCEREHGNIAAKCLMQSYCNNCEEAFGSGDAAQSFKYYTIKALIIRKPLILAMQHAQLQTIQELLL